MRKVTIGIIILIVASVICAGGILPAVAGGDGGNGGDNGNNNPNPEKDGNRLSFPVIWAEGVEKVLPGEPGMDPELGDWVYWWGPPLEDGTLQSCEPETEEFYEYYCEDGDDLKETTPIVLPLDGWQPVYPQQNAQNTWQAESADASGDASTVTDETTTIIGNPLVPRASPTDTAAKVFVVNTVPLINGDLTSFQIYNQPGSGPHTFNAYVLRPTGNTNEYTVIFDSGPLSVPSVTTGQIQTFTVTPVPVLAGDVIAHYGQGIPLDMGGADILIYPAPAAPIQGNTIVLGVDSFPIYPQDRTYSIAAEVSTGTGVPTTGPVEVDWIDWGDSIESQLDWTTNSKLRLEVVLLKDLPNPMLEYTMNHISGWGIDESWGLAATGDPVPVNPDIIATEGPGTQATVYSPCARQTIQKLLVPRENLPNLVWTWDVYKDDLGNPEPGWAEMDPDTGDFIKPSELISDIVLFNGAVHEEDGLGDDYSAEINVKGKIMFGYTWSVRDLHDNSGGSQFGEGDYRVTFSLDETCGDVTKNTDFVDLYTQILLPIEVIEEEAVTILAESDDTDGGESSGSVAYLDNENDLTYIDLSIVSK